MAAHNPGYITASTCSAIMTGKGEGFLAGGIEFAKKLADERLMIQGVIKEFEPGFIGNNATEWGNAYELDAIARYEEINFVSVHSKQLRIEKGWLSCTPDGYVNSDGLVEVKCPYTVKEHREALLNTDYVYRTYLDQVQMMLYLSGRKWCDVVSYSPRFSEPFDIVTHRVAPDMEWQSRFKLRAKEVERIISLVINQIVRNDKNETETPKD